MIVLDPKMTESRTCNCKAAAGRRSSLFAIVHFWVGLLLLPLLQAQAAGDVADIVAILPDRKSVFRNTLHNALLVSSHRNNVTLEIRDCGNYDPVQVNAIFQAILNEEQQPQPKVYIVWAFNPQVRNWMKLLHDKYGHVTAIHQFVNQPEPEQWQYLSAYTGSSTHQTAIAMSQLMIAAMEEKKNKQQQQQQASSSLSTPFTTTVTNNATHTTTSKILLMAYPETYPKSAIIASVVQEYLTNYSTTTNHTIELVDTLYAGGMSAQDSYLSILDYFQQEPPSTTRIDGILACDDMLLTGVYQALEDLKIRAGDDVLLVGNACNGNRELLEKKKQYATILQSPYLVGKLTIQTAIEIINKNNEDNTKNNHSMIVRHTPLRIMNNGDHWETTFINYSGEEYVVDELCTWNTIDSGRAAGITSLQDATNICSLIVCEHIPPPLFLVGYLMVAINYSLALMGGILVFWYRKKIVIQMAQPFFLFLVIFGSMIDTTSIIVMSRDNNPSPYYYYTDDELNTTCAVWPWLLSIGYMTTTATLVSKLYRVREVCLPRRQHQRHFTTRRNSQSSPDYNFRKVKVTVKDASIFIIAFLTMDILLLILWETLDPFRWSLNVSRRDAKGYIEEAYGICQSNTLVFPLLLGILHLMVLLYANFLVYQTRQLHKISDSKQVAISLFNSIQLLLLALPLLFLVNDNVAVSYLLRISFVFLNNFWVLLLVVYSKIHICFIGKGEEMPSLHQMRSNNSRNRHYTNFVYIPQNHHPSSKEEVSSVPSHDHCVIPIPTHNTNRNNNAQEEGMGDNHKNIHDKDIVIHPNDKNHFHHNLSSIADDTTVAVAIPPPSKEEDKSAGVVHLNSNDNRSQISDELYHSTCSNGNGRAVVALRLSKDDESAVVVHLNSNNNSPKSPTTSQLVGDDDELYYSTRSSGNVRAGVGKNKDIPPNENYDTNMETEEQQSLQESKTKEEDAPESLCIRNISNRNIVLPENVTSTTLSKGSGAATTGGEGEDEVSSLPSQNNCVVPVHNTNSNNAQEGMGDDNAHDKDFDHIILYPNDNNHFHNISSIADDSVVGGLPPPKEDEVHLYSNGSSKSHSQFSGELYCSTRSDKVRAGVGNKDIPSEDYDRNIQTEQQCFEESKREEEEEEEEDASESLFIWNTSNGNIVLPEKLTDSTLSKESTVKTTGGEEV